MTIEVATRLLPIFRKDYKSYKFKAAIIEQSGKYWNNRDAALIRKHDRLVKLYDVTKALYIECKILTGLTNKQIDEIPATQRN